MLRRSTFLHQAAATASAVAAATNNNTNPWMSSRTRQNITGIIVNNNSNSSSGNNTTSNESSSSSSSVVGNFRRRVSGARRQPDIAEWCKQHSSELRELRQFRLKEAPGVITYLGYAKDFIVSMRKAKKEHAEDKEKEAKGEEPTNTTYNPDSPVNQHLRSQELTRRFKWSKVTWDQGADFDGFSNRMLNGDIANKVPALSFLRMHLIKESNDSSSSSVADNSSTLNKKIDNKDQQQQQQKKTEKKKLSSFTNSLKTGDVTNWFFEEADESTPLVPFVIRDSSSSIKAPYRVDWETGEVFILDTASPDEVLSFLRGPAHALQTLQNRHSEEETQMALDIDVTKIYLNAFAIKYNEFDRASFSDSTRRTNKRNYVDPPEVKKFCTSVWANSVILKRYLKDQHIRILPPGEPYRIDPETKEVCIPADFEEFNTSSVHGLVSPLQRIIKMYRNTLYMWFILGLVAIGDTEFL